MKTSKKHSLFAPFDCYALNVSLLVWAMYAQNFAPNHAHANESDQLDIWDFNADFQHFAYARNPLRLGSKQISFKNLGTPIGAHF